MVIVNAAVILLSNLVSGRGGVGFTLCVKCKRIPFAENASSCLTMNTFGHIETGIRLKLREIIDYEKELVRLNGPELYFTFTYGQR